MTRTFLSCIRRNSSSISARPMPRLLAFSATQTFVISLSSKEIRIPRYPKISPSSSATRNSASSRIRNVKNPVYVNGIEKLASSIGITCSRSSICISRIVIIRFFLRSPVFSPHRHASQIPAPLFPAPPAIFSGIPARALLPSESYLLCNKPQPVLRRLPLSGG